ncbi:MAG TPA: cation:proton antiporter [Planctomycetaceae bacterium]|jgi:CPA2 family monovalent cation:H+ antiporter-2
MHDLPLITTIASAFTAAWLLGLLTQRLGLSPIVGYLLAGVLIGPYTPGFVGDVQIAQQLAEVGVILLMFGVGLHFHLKDLLAVKSVAIPGACGQSLVATLLGIAAFSWFGLPIQAGLVIGIAMSVASTVVLMRVLMDADVLSSASGHVAVGWLLVEDILTVIVLVLIPVLSGGDFAGSGAGLFAALGLAFLKLCVLVAIVMLGGARVIPWVLVQVARLRSRELFTLTILVFSIAIAVASYAFFGASMALGAFLAGMVVAQSPVSHQAAADALPMRDAFAVLFFVSVGMLFDPAFLLHQPLMILAALAIILIAKPLAALAIVAALGHSARTALTVGLGLAQIGEFSFILAELAGRYKLITDDAHHVLVGAAIISITLNPILFRSLHPIEDWLKRRPLLWRLLNARAERRMQLAKPVGEACVTAPPANGDRLAVVVGFGPVGRSVYGILHDAGISTVVIDMNIDTITELTSQGVSAVYGDATHESILEQAGIRHASHLVLTLPAEAHRTSIVTAARNLNTTARVLVRAHYLRERNDLERAGASAVVFEEAEAAVALARLVLADTGAGREVVDRKVRDLRLQLLVENGLVTIEDILKNVAVRTDNQPPRQAALKLIDAIAAGGIVIELAGRTSEQVIAELVAAIPADKLPPNACVADLAIAREREISTNLGFGVAIPHARCQFLTAPLIVVGRSSEGVVFSPQDPQVVRLVFLFVAPADQPDLQLSLLAQLARLAGNDEARDKLLHATSELEITEVIAQHST